MVPQFYRFAYRRDHCVFEKIDLASVIIDREQVDREPNPSVAIIDSQRVKAKKSGGKLGHADGKKVEAI